MITKTLSGPKFEKNQLPLPSFLQFPPLSLSLRRFSHHHPHHQLLHHQLLHHQLHHSKPPIGHQSATESHREPFSLLCKLVSSFSHNDSAGQNSPPTPPSASCLSRPDHRQLHARPATAAPSPPPGCLPLHSAHLQLLQLFGCMQNVNSNCSRFCK